ncbi:TPA: ead/Ea22-like family protein [Salmonella enterica subsp. enterica]
MSNIDKRALREVAERATPGNWRRTSSLFNGITVTPFSLCGEEVTLAHTVEKRDAEFIAAANPATMLALLDELETKEEQRANWFRMAQKLGEDLDTAERLIAELDQRLIEYAGIATREARRVAELEARTVTLPPKEHDNGTDSQIDINAGFANRMWQKCYDAIRAAGIGVKGE